MIKRLFLVLILMLGTSGGGFAASPGKIPIILDTDIGSDIDDAFALALVIKSPEFELLGVTTVSGNTNERARIAAKMLWEAGGKWRQVPVVAGVPRTPQDINQAAGPRILPVPRSRQAARWNFCAAKSIATRERLPSLPSANLPTWRR